MEKRTLRRIERQLPAVGTKLNRNFKGVTYKAKIVADKSESTGRAIEYSSKKYRSMSSAAKAITKQPTNGWLFWKIQQAGE